MTRPLRYALGTDIPLTGDWAGDGTSEIGVWRPSTAQFFLRSTITPNGVRRPQRLLRHAPVSAADVSRQCRSGPATAAPHLSHLMPVVAMELTNQR